MRGIQPLTNPLQRSNSVGAGPKVASGDRFLQGGGNVAEAVGMLPVKEVWQRRFVSFALSGHLFSP
jgi:hypothetical protein